MPRRRRTEKRLLFDEGFLESFSEVRIMEDRTRDTALQRRQARSEKKVIRFQRILPQN